MTDKVPMHKKECAYSGLPLSERGHVGWPAAEGDMCICEPEPRPDAAGVENPDKERGLYPKYRVYKYTPGEARSMKLVTDPYFVLCPETDPHARVALRKYAQSAYRAGFERLARDIGTMLRDVEIKLSRKKD